MANDVSTTLGAPQLAGSFVTPRGYVRRTIRRALGGVIIEVIAAAMTKPKPGEGPNLGIGYVAITAEEVAFVEAQQGFTGLKLTDRVVARQPRGQIVSAELDRGLLLSILTISFADGSRWEFDIQRVYKRTATEVVRALGGNLT